MPNLPLRDIGVGINTITGRKVNVQSVVEVHKRFKIDPNTQQRTPELDGYGVDIIAIHGRTQTVKLSKEHAEIIEKISAALREHKLVKINFGEPSTLRGRCYAMNSNGQLLSGVSCTATEINILAIEDDDIDYDVIDY
jgi:hypothetical protein